MKNLVLLAFLCTLVGITNAQEKKQKNTHENWATELNLTDAQSAEIKKIDEKYRIKSEETRKTATAMEIKKLRDEKEAEVNQVLTPEQLQKLKEMRERKIKEKEEKAAIREAQK